MIAVDSFAYLSIRVREARKFLEIIHSNGFNSPSMVGINSVTVG